MQITLDKNTEYIINALENAGYEAFAVGGYVRDKLMGREVTDCDITTSAKPTEIKQVFSDHKVIETGIKHGTVTVVIGNVPYEITTFRAETGYTDSRHPDSVSFISDLRADLSRRDFTINALAFAPNKGIVDMFDGIADIKAKLIRAVGDPYKRFSEDSLRILRALRFSAVLGFEIERETSNAVLLLADSILKVSPERIYTELQKLLLGINASEVIAKYSAVISKIMPLGENAVSIHRLPADSPMRFSALFGENSIKALSVLHADNYTKKKCALLLDSNPIPTDETQLKLYISSYGRENAAYITLYRRCMFNEDLSCQTEKLLSENLCLSVSELAVNGNDLLSIGVQGKNIGAILNKLLYLVIIGEIKNEKAILLQIAIKNNTVN